ncbi:MAG: ABC transporter ATP-binding protein/permease [Clostridiales bacterium]|nr:ABC transporter ATP-binding protein/permease [Clostridiales bacterium]
MKKVNRPQNAFRAMRRLFAFLKPWRARLALIAFCVVLLTAGSVTGTYMLKPLFNSVAEMFDTGSRDFTHFFTLLAMLGALYLVTVVLNYLSPRLMLPISTGALLRLRTEMFAHMQKLPLSYFDSQTHGEIMSRYTNDTDTLREMLSQALPSLFAGTLTILGIVTIMLVLSPMLTLVVLCAFALMIFIAQWFSRRSVSLFRGRQAELAATNGFAEEHIEGQREVQAFCREEQTRADFEILAERLRSVSAGASAWSIVIMPVMGNLNYVLCIAVAVVGVLLMTGGRSSVDIGTLAAFLQYCRQFSQPITQISQQMNIVLNALAGVERIFALLDEPTETDEGGVTLRKEEDRWYWRQPDGAERPLCGDVRFEHVTFGYNSDVEVLKDVSLFAKPGQKIAFVGATGAGKTTIASLLNRFYDIEQGQITYDGINVKDIKKDDLRRSLATVLQDTHLFTGTVRENIRYGRLDATDAEVEQAAKLANAHYFISRLPQGYDTVLTADGGNLSQGQRQLLAIARAAVADPPVLVLDEATSSIDTRTERLIEKGMDRLMSGRTVFVIAHRLSTVRNADAILVLENGRIIERGDHDDLLAQRGRYYQLYMGMFELS